MKIAISGLGIICSIGNDTKTVLCSLKNKTTGIGAVKYLSTQHKELPVGEVKLSDEEMKSMLSIDKDMEISRTTLMGTIAIREAINSSGITNLQSKKIILISGTTVGGMDLTEKHFLEMSNGTENVEIIKKHDCGSCTSDMANLAGISNAEICTISTACSSALNSVILGAEMLKKGEVDVVIAGGSEALSLFHLNGFNSLMILDNTQCRPFDANRAGLNLGEGAAFVVMSRENIVNSKDVLAYVSGYGNACDAFHQTASSENGEGAYLAMKKALEMASLEPSEIQYVNAHGTGTQNNDSSESQALKRIFGENLPFISSTKSFTGHTTSASGSIELVISILAMQNHFVPCNLNWKEAMEDGIVPSLGEENVTLSNIICNSFGFGGNDSSLIISKEADKDAEETVTQNIESEIVAEYEICSSDSLSSLKEFVSPLESRRMGKLLKAATLTSMQVLKTSGIECPDAIITATSYGMLETSEKFLSEMCTNGEYLLKPTLFIQSTHNTIGSSIAMRTKCHGYNVTYTQGGDSLYWAIRDAKRLISTGKARTVLVGVHDESTPLFNTFRKKMNEEELPEVYSHSILFAAKK